MNEPVGNQRALRAKLLRGLARQYEQHGHENDVYYTQYTCVSVGGAFPSGPERAAYEDVFGIGDPLSDSSETLWNTPRVERQNLRVLMLCFAAAMAETGDLL